MSDVEAIRRAQEELPRIYRDPAQYDLLAQMTAPKDLPFYLRMAEEHGGPILELGCGTGRVALELAAAGFEVVGVDLSAAAIAYAAQKAQLRGVGVTLLQGDLRSFDCERVFPLLLVTYNSFNHLLTLDDLRAFFARARAHMDASSRLVIDTFQPSPAFLANDVGKERPILRYLDPYLQKEVILHERHDYDPATQVDTVRFRYEVSGVEGAAHDAIRMRLFFPQELDALLALSGFTLEHKLGDYDGSPFGSGSPKQLVVCRLAG
ncbi:MAG: methyltransferase domain-containing protein [Sandaracinaceae bacterium]|nr:methyltransferase domain-containing protein [Sandaracinaceae bacterium]